MRDVQQQRERDASSGGTASSAVDVAPGANVTGETPAESVGEAGPGPTAPSSEVRVGLPVLSLIVTYPVWIGNFPRDVG